MTELGPGPQSPQVLGVGDETLLSSPAHKENGDAPTRVHARAAWIAYVANWTVGPKNTCFKAAPVTLVSRVCNLCLYRGLRAAAMMSHKLTGF